MLFTRRCLGLFGSKIGKKLEHYSQFQPSSLTIQQYLDFGRNGTAQTSFMFLKKELLVRLANIMQVSSMNCVVSPAFVLKLEHLLILLSSHQAQQTSLY